MPRLLACLTVTLVTAGASAHPPAHHVPSPAESAHTDAARARQTIAFLEDRLAAEPADTLSLSKLGAIELRVARRTGEHDDLARAEGTFRRLLAVDPASVGARAGLAYSLLGQHRFHEALESARAASDGAPDNVEIRALLGDVHFALGHYAEAEAFFMLVADAEVTLHSLARLALVLEHRGRLDEADTTYHDALEAGRLLGAAPADLAWCHTMIGEFDLALGAPDDAAAHFRAALALDPGAHAATLRLARIDLLRGEASAAREALTALVERSPKPAHRIALGEALAALGEGEAARGLIAGAEAEMRERVDHGDFGHARELVELWLAHGGDPDRAAALALRDLEEVRRDARAYETAAWALHRAGRTGEALGLMETALRLGGADARTLWRAAEIHEAAGDDVAARLLLDRARRRNPMIEQMVAAG